MFETSLIKINTKVRTRFVSQLFRQEQNDTEVNSNQIQDTIDQNILSTFLATSS